VGKNQKSQDQGQDYYDNSFNKIAEEMGVTPAGALYIYNEALKKIRRKIKQGSIKNYESLIE